MNPHQGIEGLSRGPQAADGLRMPRISTTSFPSSGVSTMNSGLAPKPTDQESPESLGSSLLADLRRRVARARAAAQALQLGQGVLVADDGSRENEVDFVFHAAAATAELVNTAIRDCRGLLCVSVSPERADALGLYTAPKTPAQVALTGFTVSVDARHGIGSGISAADRAQTIAFLGCPTAQPSDFVTPGHVFPVRAAEGLLCQRAGHTEAVLELCKLAQRPQAAAMCECLAEDGRALDVAAFQDGALPKEHPLAGLAFVSTIDLLWTRLLTQPLTRPTTELVPDRALPLAAAAGIPSVTWNQLQLSADPHCQDLLLPCAIWLRSNPVCGPSEERVTWRWVGAPQDEASVDSAVLDTKVESSWAVVVVFDPLGRVPLPTSLTSFCDLSTKEGLGSCAPGARRLLTLIAIFEALAHARRQALTLSNNSPKGPQQTMNPAQILQEDLAFMAALARAYAPPVDAEVITEVLKLRLVNQNPYHAFLHPVPQDVTNPFPPKWPCVQHSCTRAF